ncbi:phosphatase PAP2 family protein [Candidatus Peregrinibacteria bacterium]|nr:phosphatase PAP2 family protein [Candidatus Peregrinibacteria bacterium]
MEAFLPDALRDFDYRIFKIFNNFAGKSQALDAALIALSEYVMFLMIAGLALFVLLRKDRIRSAAALQAFTAAFIGRAIIVSLVRIFFFRVRPFVAGTVLQLVDHNPLEGSFPSGHATVMFSLAFSLLFVNRRWGFFYLFLAIISSLARITVGVHFPFDILGGIVVAAVSAFAAKWIFDFWLTRRRRKEAAPQ